VGLLLLGWEGERIQELEAMVDKKIYLYISEYIHTKKYNIGFGSLQKMNQELPELSEGQELEVEIKENHPLNFQDGITWVNGHIIEISRAGNLVGKRTKIKINRMSTHFSKGELS